METLEKGYQIVPISELIYRDNYHLNHERRQSGNQDREYKVKDIETAMSSVRGKLFHLISYL